MALVTTDVALKLLAKAATQTAPTAELLRQKRPIALIMDEVQRCPAETYVALANDYDTIVAVGDSSQVLYPLTTQGQPGGSSGKAKGKGIQVQTVLKH